ncbi:MAG: DUF1902 domain-containing protein [Acetobacterales bacterium]
MQKASIIVRAQWDDEAEVWVATSDDVPRLATEAATQEELLRKVRTMIPELVTLNGGELVGDLTEIPLYLVSEQRSTVRLRA